ncbi:LysM peptidoglycan-binding domain-containing protein [Ureibacillus manganicus]|uniref:LysM domain-containing protein n=1 Tax=Ureibacillus manganicus DSM 26584 TaxID=1384049 RepID=A0A0A3I446_9BACL|nr:LysM peptidoglycan-binding domain-containing protein [Ureibacillus manganicus]KGR79576.1 hypothetical protein CD29_05610 [Ureibacillus manganicus DSM 26584]
MSKKDYREKIEQHRQSIDVEKPNSRQSRSRYGKNKKPRRRDPLMTILTVIFIFIPLVVLVYIWGFYTPTTPSKAQGNEETLEYEKNDKLEEDETTIDEPVLIDDTVDENKEEDDLSENDNRNSNEVDQSNDKQSTNKDTSSAETSTEKEKKDEQISNGKHKVETGDTLYKIANERNTTVDAIMEANGMQTPDIQVGQTLIIP